MKSSTKDFMKTNKIIINNTNKQISACASLLAKKVDKDSIRFAYNQNH